MEFDLECFQKKCEERDSDKETLSCDHNCCTILKMKLNEVQEELNILKRRYDDDMNWVKHEFSKLVSPIENLSKEGDFFLEGKWKVSGKMLEISANDNGTGDLHNLFDSVFGQATLKQYNSYNSLPSDLLSACNSLIGK